MRKFVSILVTLCMVLTMSVSVLANTAATARMVGNGNNARLHITVGDVTLDFANPGNATRVFEVNGQRIEVVTQGNSVRSFRDLGPVATPAPAAPPAPGGVATANAPLTSTPPTPTPTPYAFTRNVGFHCNDIEGGGNGRVRPAGYNGENLGFVADGNRDNGNAIWALVSKDFVCPDCGRTDWVNFSNNSGVPNGNNIQLNHPAPSRRNITVTVTYTINIPECKDIDCVIDCKEVDCDVDCGKCLAGFLCEDCEDDCVAECLFVPCLACPIHKCTPCPHAVNAREQIVRRTATVRFREVPGVGNTMLPVTPFVFEHEAPATWRGGATANAVTGRLISADLLQNPN